LDSLTSGCCALAGLACHRHHSTFHLITPHPHFISFAQKLLHDRSLVLDLIGIAERVGMDRLGCGADFSKFSPFYESF
jgi:hypothetical protein